MKTSIMITLFMCSGVSALAQGTLNFANYDPPSLAFPIYGVDPSNPTVRTFGQSAEGIPPGATVYGGAKLSGTGFTVALWAGPGPAQLVQCDTSTFRTGTMAGYWISKVTAIQSVAAGQPAVVEFRVWDNQGGTITTWDAAVASGTALGHSDSLTYSLGGQVPGGPILPRPDLLGMQSFSLTQVPEPCAVGLATLGMAIILGAKSRRLGSRIIN